MAIDRQELFKLIARRPLIRTVEIADLLDCEPDQILPELQGHIERRQMLTQKVIAPNGKEVTGFEFSELFKTTKAYKLMVTETEEKPTPKAINFEMVDPPHERTKWKKTKVDLAIEYITLHGRASSNDLRELLVTTAHPSVYLGAAVKAGLICRDGNEWFMPGTSAPAEPAFAPLEAIPQETGITPQPADPAPAAADAFEKSMDDFLKHIPAMAKTAMERAPAPVVIDPERFSQEFACALWSNGALQLRRYGQDLAVLSANEREYLSKFLRKFISA